MSNAPAAFSSPSPSANAVGAPIRIFRPGTFVSVEGREVSFSALDLSAIASSYDAGGDPAPLVIGHPKLNDPAWGWVKSLSVEGDVLVAHPERVEPSFAETVREGRYAKVSAQFYPPEHTSNPKPGSWYLKHVGFLGAAAPAVKGLGVVSLAARDNGIEPGDLITIDLNPVTQENDMPEPKKGEDVSFAEREADLSAREAALKARETAVEKAAAEARHADNVSFAEGLIAQAKLSPAGKPLLVGVLDELGDTAAVSFGEAGELTPVAALKKLLGGAQPLVSLGEIAGADKGEPGAADPATLAADAISFAEAEAKAGRTITIAAAVRHIEKKGKN